MLIYAEPSSHLLPAAQQTYLDKGVNYAAKTWAEWEKSESGWKVKVVGYGNTMLRKIPYEEWGLKSIPPLRASRREQYEKSPATMRVEVQYPRLYEGLVQESVVDVCRRLSTERQGLHKTRLVQSVVGMPLTIPFGLIPM